MRLKIDSGPSISYEVYGNKNARPLIVLPGVLEPLEAWYPVADYFKNYKTILVDFESRFQYKPGIRARADEIEALVEKEANGLKPFGLGFSFGSLELLTYSAIYQNSLEGQVLVSLIGLTPRERLLRAFFWPLVEPLLWAAEQGYLLAILDKALYRAVKRAIKGETETEEGRLSVFVKKYPGIKAYAKSLNNHRHPWLKRIKIPTQILVGEKSYTSISYVEKILPDFGTKKVEVHLIPKSNHSPHAENSEEFIKKLEYALKRLETK